MSLPQTVAGGFAHRQLHAILAEACDRVGLGSNGATLLRGHSNAVFLLDTAPVVVKILRRGTDINAAIRTTRLAQWLQDQGFPTVPLHPGIDQPQVIDGHAVTYWTYIPQPATPVDAADLGLPLRLLHSLPPPPTRLAPINVLDAIRRSISNTTMLHNDELDLLDTRLHELAREYADMSDGKPQVVLHGDPQHRNALTSLQGTLLCDWDSAVTGVAAWDLVTIDVHCRRFGYPPAHYDAFVAAYGRDIREWKGYRVFRDLRELRMITTNARKAQLGAILAEVRHRIRGLRGRDTEQLWNIL